jgi:F-type H+-transporting ATPase subunit delta
MHGASRDALARLREEIPQRSDDPQFAGLPDELLAVAALLGREHSLRNALSDAGTPADVRASLVEQLLGGRVSGLAVIVVQQASRARWSRARDLPDALEILAAQAGFLRAEREGTLDAVEDELFRFGRTVEGQAELRGALDSAQLGPDRKVALLRDLLQDRVQPLTFLLLEHVVRSPRGRRVEEAIDDLAQLAAERREEILAEVRVAAPLEADQEQRLAGALRRVYGRAVHLQVTVRPRRGDRDGRRRGHRRQRGPQAGRGETSACGLSAPVITPGPSRAH